MSLEPLLKLICSTCRTKMEMVYSQGMRGPRLYVCTNPHCPEPATIGEETVRLKQEYKKNIKDIII